MDTPSFEKAASPPLRFESCNAEHDSVDKEYNYNEDDSINMQTYNMMKELSVLKKGYDLRFALILMTVAFFVMLGAFLGAVVFSLYVLKNSSIDSNDGLSFSGNTPHTGMNQKYEYIGLSDLNLIPLTHLEEMQSLVLQWGSSGSGKQYFYNIQGAYRDGVSNTTTLHLSNQHSLVATTDNAVLLDKDSNELGVLNFVNGHVIRSEDDIDTDNGSSSSSVVTNAETLLSPLSSSDGRRLGKIVDNIKLDKLFKNSKHKKGRVPGGPPADMFDAYCRYGCGGMAVTFPYYYRPHFGYGYPLVGTQSQFPQGYGGYAGAPIMREAHEQYVSSPGGGGIPLPGMQ